MAKASLVGQLRLTEVRGIIDHAIVDSSVTGEVQFEKYYPCETGDIQVVVYEKYYYRSANRASLTAVIAEKDGQTTVDLVSTGGGQGMVFRFNWGAEKSFVNKAVNALISKGFRSI